MGHRSRRRLVALTLLGLAWQLSPGFGLRDGVAFAATCSEGVAWVRQMASSQQLALAGMAATPDGGLAVAVTFKGELSLTGLQPEPRPLLSGGGSASVLLKLSSTGALAWLRHLTGVDVVSALTVRRDGTIVVGGSFRRQAALEAGTGQPPLPIPGDLPNVRLYLGFYGPDGTPRVARVVADTGGSAVGSARIAALAETGDGGVAIEGLFSGTMLAGAGQGQVRLTSRGWDDLFLALVRDDGALAWALRAGGEGIDAGGHLTAGTDGSLLMSGTFAESGPGRPAVGATVGDGPKEVLHAIGPSDALLARVGGDGRLAWAQAIGGDERNRGKPVPGASMFPSPESVAGLVPEPGGGTLVAVSAPLPLHFGRGGAKAVAPGHTWSSFLAHLSVDGRLRSAVPLGPKIDAMTLLPGGDVVVVGDFADTIRYPVAGTKRVTLTSAGRTDVLIARHGPDGTLRWATRFGGLGYEAPRLVTADATGAVTLAGSFDKDFDLDGAGCAPVRFDRSAREGIFLVRIAPGAALSDEPRTRRLAEVAAEVKTLKANATRAYRGKRYAAACPLYQRLVELQPDDPPAMADLAVCLQRLGRSADAVAANQKAIALGARTEQSDYGDEPTRRHAYYNLAKLGEVVKLPPGRCGKLAPAPGCERSLWACAADGRADWRAGGSDWSTVRVGVSQDEAEIDADEHPEAIMPSLGLTGVGDADSWARIRNFVLRATSVDILREKKDETLCLGDASDDCTPWESSISCDIVFADACLGLVATACTADDGTGDKTPARPSIDEFYLELR
jgi:hypothetical protein